MKELDLTNNVNREVSIDGIAQNARLGAIVMTDDFTAIFLDGIKTWESNIKGKNITVTGILRRKGLAPKAVVSPNGEISHGIENDGYVLDNPTWELAR